MTNLVDTIRECSKPGIMTDARVCLAQEVETMQMFNLKGLVNHATMSMINMPHNVISIIGDRVYVTGSY